MQYNSCLSDHCKIGYILRPHCFLQAGAAYLAFLRYKQGSDQAFAPSYEADPSNAGGYSSYPDATDPDGGYSQPPFGGQPGQPQQPGTVTLPPAGYQSEA